ncbi:MAG: DUF1844 domain-containing protein [Verrucomicrobia bacterium]|nr:MAG: DUF1844 domain-containing protein [Verrucomicrobiota bacterium]
MSETNPQASHAGDLSREEAQSALFVQLVIQLSNMAAISMGQVPHPETKQTLRDLDAARMFIDQLEMLEARTKGNLRKEEESFLKQSLMSLRMSFVEAQSAPEDKTPPAESASGAEETKTRFSKSYPT